MLFWNNDYSRGLAGHMRPVTSVGRPAIAPSATACVIDLRSAQVYCVAIFLVSQEVSLNFHRFCG